MISEAELRRNAGALGMDPMIQDLDYVLGVFLGEWYREEKGRILRFKGGTCLRKCYFQNHRFSKDLDFTAELDLGPETIDGLLTRVSQRTQETFGLNLVEGEWRRRIVQDRRGGMTIEIRLYYRGPLRRTGAPQAIQLHITTPESEYLSPTKSEQKIIHPYSDAVLLEEVIVPCYTLQEILSEKLRAICGQRRFAISRDVFDVYKLVTEGQVEFYGLGDLLQQKFEIKGIPFQDIIPDQIEARREQFEQDWFRDLQHLLPVSQETTFDKAWNVTIETISRIVSA
jgi:predicted nucleotidyltransferase component of viral defense system